MGRHVAMTIASGILILLALLIMAITGGCDRYGMEIDIAGRKYVESGIGINEQKGPGNRSEPVQNTIKATGDVILKQEVTRDEPKNNSLGVMPMVAGAGCFVGLLACIGYLCRHHARPGRHTKVN